MDPTIDLKQNPTNDFQKWAVGTVFKTVHQGANKCLSNAAVVENYEIGYEMVNEYHNTQGLPQVLRTWGGALQNLMGGELKSIHGGSMGGS